MQNKTILATSLPVQLILRATSKDPIGTADFNENSNLNIEEIIQSADKNMYLNKSDFHKNNVF